MQTPKKITDRDFNQTVSEGITLVDFWAPWCGPCQQQLKALDQVAAEVTSENVTIAKVNIDEEPQLAQRFGIRSIPTLLTFKDNEVKDRLNGYTPADKLSETLRALEALSV